MRLRLKSWFHWNVRISPWNLHIWPWNRCIWNAQNSWFSLKSQVYWELVTEGDQGRPVQCAHFERPLAAMVILFLYLSFFFCCSLERSAPTMRTTSSSLTRKWWTPLLPVQTVVPLVARCRTSSINLNPVTPTNAIKTRPARPVVSGTLLFLRWHLFCLD